MKSFAEKLYVFKLSKYFIYVIDTFICDPSD